MTKLDKKDCKILNILQHNCRTSLTDIAKQVGLSIDSVTKRIKKLTKKEIFYPTIHIRPNYFGFTHIVDVKIKLNNHSKKEIDSFIGYLKENPRVTELFSVSGEWDISLVIISRDVADLEKINSDINHRFGEIINSWSESTTLKAYKFNEYDMQKLLGL